METNSGPLTNLLLDIAETKNTEAMYGVILRFDPVLTKYANQLKHECAKTDLIIFLIELLSNLKKELIIHYSEGQLVTYLVQSLAHKKIDMYRKQKLNPQEVPIEEANYVADGNMDTNPHLNIWMRQSLKRLTPQQQKVIIKKYFYGYSDIEIGTQLHISRQAINKLKTRAFISLRSEFEER